MRLKDAWLVRIRRQNLKPENIVIVRVCSDHFVTRRPVKLYVTTHQDWALLLNVGYYAPICDSGQDALELKDVIGQEQYSKSMLRATP